MSTKFLRIQSDGFMELRDLDQERDLLDVIMKEDYDDGEPDLFGLDEDDTAELIKKLHGLIVITEVE